MRAVEIALKDIKIVARDFKALLIIIAMPLILIMILGAALGPMFARSESISRFSVAVADLDGGRVAAAFTDLLKSEQISRLVTLVPAQGEAEAEAMVREGKVSCAVVIPKGVSDPANTGTKSLKVLSDPGYEIRGQVIRGVAESFAEQYSAVYAGVSGTVSSLLGAVARSSLGALTTDPESVSRLAARIQEKLLSQTAQAPGLFESAREKASWITATQYYTASMTIMFVMFGSMLGAKSILEEKSQKTLARLFSTRAVKGDIVAGKTLATYVISALQMAILIGFTSLAYKTKWGHPGGVLLVTAALALASTGFCVMAAALARTERAADAIESFGVQLMAFLGGCQFPMYAFPPFLQRVSKMTLTRWGLDGYLALMQGQNWSSALMPATVLACMGLAFLGVGIWRLDLE